MHSIGGSIVPGFSLSKIFLLPALLAVGIVSSALADIPDIETPGVFEVVAGGNGDVVGSPALTFNFESHTTALEIDSKGRLYFENHGFLRRVEADRTVSSFKEGFYAVADFYIQGEHLYYAEGTGLYRVDLNSDETSDITPAGLVLDGFIGDLAVDSQENIYFSSQGRIYIAEKASGTVRPFAGQEETCWECDPFVEGDVALEVSVNPSSLLIDPANDSLIFVDFDTSRIASIHPETGLIDILVDASSEIFADPYSGTEGIMSIDLLPNGDLIFSDGNQHVWQADSATGQISVFAGRDQYVDQFITDGLPLGESRFRPDQLTVDKNGNIYTSTSVRTDYGDPDRGGQRVLFLDVENDLVSSVMGAPGALACQGPTERLLVQGKDLFADDSGKIHMIANQAILAVDNHLDIMYQEAGQYGTLGISEDGLPALGSPIFPQGKETLAKAPNGDLYFSGAYGVRKIVAETGRLETVTEGSFRSLKFTNDGRLIGLMQIYYYAFDYIDAFHPSVVEINIDTGEQTILLSEGSLEGYFGDRGYDTRYEILDFEVMEDGSILLLTSGELVKMSAPGWEPEIIFHAGLTGFSFSYSFLSDLSSEMVLDESGGFIYFSHVYPGDGPYAAIMRYNLETGESYRYAIGGDPWVGQEPKGNPMFASFNPKAMTLEPDGNLLFITSNYVDESEHVVRIISPENARLSTDDIGSGAKIGESVARAGEWMAIGVPQIATSGSSTGQILLYRDNDCRPILQQRLEAPEGLRAREFGKTVVIAGDHLVVAGSEPEGTGQPFRLGAYRLVDDGKITLERDLSSHVASADNLDVNTLASFGEGFTVGVPSAAGGTGEVLIFDTSNLAASPSRISSPNSSHTEFGRSVALHQGHLAVGSRNVQANGTVDLFERQGSAWQLITNFPNQKDTKDFGASLALDEKNLYVGTPDADGGLVYRYEIEGSSTPSEPVARIGGAGAGSGSSFGSYLSLSLSSLIIGEPGAVVTVSSRQAKGQQGLDAEPGKTTGKVHVYRVADRAGPVYDETPLVPPLSVSATQDFGASLDVDNGRLLVGAPGTDEDRGEFVSVGEIIDPSLLSGLWWDPQLDGEGYNVLVTDSGLVVFYYGYDAKGQRLWLISELIPKGFRYGENINTKVFKATQGEFDAPVPSSEALIEYGLLSMAFGSNQSATFTLTGFDGAKISRGEFLADMEANSAAYSGLWFNPSLDGEGFNVISGQHGTVVYYYGSSREGERLWLLTELMNGDVEDGTTLRGTVYEMVGGYFLHPAPSSQALRTWGTIEARFDDCNDGRFVLDGSDGYKAVELVKLAGVGGTACLD